MKAAGSKRHRRGARTCSLDLIHVAALKLAADNLLNAARDCVRNEKRKLKAKCAPKAQSVETVKHPQAPPKFDPASIFCTSLQLLKPEHIFLALSLPPEFVVEFLWSIARTSRAATLSEFTFRQQKKEAGEISSLFAQVSRLVDDTIEGVIEINTAGTALPSTYRDELIDALKNGYLVELDALQTAASSGQLDKFFESRLLPGYGEARASVQKARAARKGSNAGKNLFTAEESMTDEVATWRSEPNFYLKKKPFMRKAFEKYFKEIFCRTLPDSLLRYWLPCALWTYSTGDALRILAETTAAGKLTETDEMKLRVVSKFSTAMGAKPAVLAAILSKVRIQDIRPTAFDTAVSRLNLYRATPPPWTL